MFQAGKRIGLLFIVLNFVFSSFAQTEVDKCFRNLKNGGILVRLQSRSLLIKALKEKNDTIGLTNVICERDKVNEEIINAFQDFDYCPVYFFFAANSRKILKKDFKEILLDKNLLPVDPLPNLQNNYLIASFQLSKGYSSYIDDQNVDQNGIERTDKNKNELYFESGIDALILLEPDFSYIEDKYPAYVRTFEHLPFFSRTKKEVVMLLKNNIEKFINERYIK